MIWEDVVEIVYTGSFSYYDPRSFAVTIFFYARQILRIFLAAREVVRPRLVLFVRHTMHYV